jgi:hypothetical protein
MAAGGEAMNRVTSWVLLGVGIAVVISAIVSASMRVRSDRRADCGTAYKPSELVGYLPVESSAGCAGAFDTIQSVAVGLAYAGAACAIAGAGLLLTGRVVAGLIGAVVIVAGSGLWLSSLEGNPVRNGAPALLLVILLLMIAGAGAVVHRLSQPQTSPRR